MRRRLRRLLLLVLVVALVGGAAAIVVATKPTLDDQRDLVDARWNALRQPLITRYQALANVAQALHDAGAGDRAVTKALDEALPRWFRSTSKKPGRSDFGTEAQSANELEALATRVATNVSGSDRLKSNPLMTEALNAFALATVPPPAVEAYNQAVRDYQRTRDDTIDGIVAGVFGYDARPELVVSGG